MLNTLYKQNHKYRNELKHKKVHIRINLPFEDGTPDDTTDHHTVSRTKTDKRVKLENCNLQVNKTKKRNTK